MQRRVPGLTAKVLNERLRKLLRFGIIERQIYAEVPPRVEYRLTAFGRRFDGVLKEIAALDAPDRRAVPAGIRSFADCNIGVSPVRPGTIYGSSVAPIR